MLHGNQAMYKVPIHCKLTVKYIYFVQLKKSELAKLQHSMGTFVTFCPAAIGYAWMQVPA